MPHNILNLSVFELLEEYRNKTLSPVDAVKTALKRIELLNPTLNAFCLIEKRETLLQKARESEARWAAGSPCGALDGVLVSIKDSIDVAGWPTREGSLTSSDAPMQNDMPCVARLREKGAIFLGKTTLPEFGLKGVTSSPLYGITRNPWNPAKTAGGSSGGAAVAAATGMGYLHLGSDGGGSLRIPASFCGVFGFKPTQDLVQGGSPNPFSPLATIGPITRYAKDAALMFDIMVPDNSGGHACEKPNNLRIAYLQTINDTPIDPEVADFVKSASEKLGGMGTIEEISLNMPKMVNAFNTHWMAIAAWVQSKIPEDRHSDMDPYVQEWVQRGKALSLNDFLDAQVEFMSMIAQIETLFMSYDAIIMPTMAMSAFKAEDNVANNDNGTSWDDWTPLTFPANIAKLPAASIPCGITKDGLPVGVQLIAATGKDAMLLNLSKYLQQEIGFEDWLSLNLTDDNRADRITGTERANKTKVA